MKLFFLAFLVSLSAFGQKKVERVVQESLIPEGSVIAFARVSCPSGWLAADGSQVSRSTYARLFAATGTIHGSGNGSTTFHVPDYRGRFLRGVAGGQATDPDRGSRTAMNTGGNTGDSVGSVQGHQFGSHNHGVTDPGHSHIIGTSTYNPSGPYANFGRNDVNGPLNFGPTSTNTTGISLQLSGGNETRPVNAYVLYCIKY